MAQRGGFGGFVEAQRGERVACRFERQAFAVVKGGDCVAGGFAFGVAFRCIGQGGGGRGTVDKRGAGKLGRLGAGRLGRLGGNGGGVGVDCLHGICSDCAPAWRGVVCPLGRCARPVICRIGELAGIARGKMKGAKLFCDNVSASGGRKTGARA